MTTIVHTTDLVHDDRTAFEHSVALARIASAKLIALHANAPDDATEHIPNAADVLSAWGVDPAGVAFEKRIHNCCDDPVETVLDALRTIKPDLVVAGSHRRGALARFFAGSRAEAIARNVAAPTLLFPDQARRFVAAADGALDMRRILVPIGDPEEAAAALRAAAWLADLGQAQQTEFVLVHVGAPPQVAPALPPAHPGWTFRHENIPTGTVEDAVARYAGDACVVVMASRGHDSVHDVLVGSHTDRVLSRTSCPLLCVRV